MKPKRCTPLLLCLLAGWCLLFLRCESTDKSMVRAVYLAQAGQRWQVGLLYQAPQAAADAAEASAALQFVQAEGLTLVRVRLYTGRTHQIRVQFSSRGWPLTGDGKYGSRNNRCAPALWSAELHFAHPVTGETLIFRSQPPEAYPWTLFSPDFL